MRCDRIKFVVLNENKKLLFSKCIQYIINGKMNGEIRFKKKNEKKMNDALKKKIESKNYG
jgi:hypothetical protein